MCRIWRLFLPCDTRYCVLVYSYYTTSSKDRQEGNVKMSRNATRPSRRIPRGAVPSRIGMTGLEPAASCSQSRHSTKLSYIPFARRPRAIVIITQVWPIVNPFFLICTGYRHAGGCRYGSSGETSSETSRRDVSAVSKHVSLMFHPLVSALLARLRGIL